MRIKICLVVLLGIFLIGSVLASAPPGVSNVYNSPESPCIEEDVTICAQISDEFGINSVRLNLFWVAHHENIFMYEEGEEYCRTISPDYFDSFIGQEISYYIVTSNDFGTHQTILYDFTYQICEAPIIPPFCGDGTCNADETCGDTDIAPECNTDCGICEEEPSPENETNQTEDDDEDTSHTTLSLKQFCEPNWRCGGWSSCDDGRITRTCYDASYCDYSYNKPNEVAGCGISEYALVDEGDNQIYVVVFLGVLSIVSLIVLVSVLGKR